MGMVDGVRAGDGCPMTARAMSLYHQNILPHALSPLSIQPPCQNSYGGEKGGGYMLIDNV